MNEFSDDSILQTQNDQHIDGKAKMVYEMLSELKMHEKETIAKTFLVMTTSPECCAAIKRMSKAFAKFKIFFNYDTDR